VCVCVCVCGGGNLRDYVWKPAAYVVPVVF